MSRRRAPISARAGQGVAYVLMALIMVYSLLPAAWMILIALKPPSSSMTGAKVLDLTNLTFANFASVNQLTPIATNVSNSLFTTIVGTLTTLFFCSLAGYAFAKIDFPGREPIFYILIATMLVPPEVAIIPLFRIMTGLSLVNSLWALIIPKMATAVGIFYMRQYISAVPNEVIEAARVDGCGPFRIYLQIVLPMIKPGLAVWATLTVIARWNDFFWPLVFLRSEDKYTLVQAISLLPVGEGLSTPWPVIMAGTSIAVIPPVIGYIIFQRFQKADMTAGAVKG
ncbi:carbohydrate ABC transporter permease [Tessaracoccus sp.]|uniref:carbohydrate ABC transporter permease n=1 Tax=Tessaracoccus sp. TaxID=1971211 RepID=UPI00262D583D|nr:carbohydrate ABC transporter permease [Tessaracoccus sp.]